MKTIYVVKCTFNNQHYNALTSNAIFYSESWVLIQYKDVILPV